MHEKNWCLLALVVIYHIFCHFVFWLTCFWISRTAGMFDQGEKRTATARFVTPKAVSLFFGIYILHYYFKYNLGVCVHMWFVALDLYICTTFEQMSVPEMPHICFKKFAVLSKFPHLRTCKLNLCHFRGLL